MQTVVDTRQPVREECNGSGVVDQWPPQMEQHSTGVSRRGFASRCTPREACATLRGYAHPCFRPARHRAYLAAAGGLARPLLSGRQPLNRLALVLAGVAVLLHMGILLGMHRGALDLHFFAALSLVACVVAALTLLVNLSRPVAALGVIVFPLAAALLALDSFVAPPTTPMQMEWPIKLHVTLALLAFSVLSIAAVLALLLAAQERALRVRNFGDWLRALPPLTRTEALMFRLISSGFALLTLALLSGALFIDNIRAQHLVHTTVLSVLAWLVFGTLLYGRWRHGWRGARARQPDVARHGGAGAGVLRLASSCWNWSASPASSRGQYSLPPGTCSADRRRAPRTRRSTPINLHARRRWPFFGAFALGTIAR